MRTYIPLIVTVLFLQGCATASYTPPPTAAADPSEYTIIVNKPYDVAWQDLINHASSTFFAIDQFEKDSGLMTLEFGASDAARFIDCGEWNDSTGFSGNYASHLAQRFNGTLSGKMNILVSPEGDDQSRIRVNARYIFQAPPQTWTFDTGSSATVDVGTSAAMGTGTGVRTCKPTYVAENSVLDALRR